MGPKLQINTADSHVFLNSENVFFRLKTKLGLQRKPKRNRTKRMRKMKTLVAYGSNLKGRMALLCGWLMQEVAGEIFPKH